MASAAQGKWRVATANGMLLACYLVPAWAFSVWKIWTAPVRGLFDVANLGPAIFAANMLQLAPPDLVRFALLVALIKFTVVVFFVAFIVFSLSSLQHEREEGAELLHVGLALAATVSIVSMALAWRFGEGEALRLHATESLMILSAAIVALVDVPQAAAHQAGVAQDAVVVRADETAVPAPGNVPS